MPNWTRMTPPAAGAFSATWITRIGGLEFALILAGAFLVQSCFSTVPTDPESLREPEGIAGDRATVQLGARVQDLEQRAALDAAAAERELATQGAGLGGAQLTPAFNETTGEALPGPPVPLTEGEAELREVLRLEAIERRTRSLRSAPIAITYRRPETGGLAPAAAEPTADAPAQADAPVDDSRASTPLIPEPVSLMDTIQALQALDAQQTAGAELDAGRARPSGRQIQPPAVSPLGSPDSARVAQGDPVHPAIVRAPNTPPRMGADIRRLVSRGGAREPTQRRLSRSGPRVRGRAVLLGRPAADGDPARRARDRIAPRLSPARIKHAWPSGFTASSSRMVDGCRWSFAG